MRRVWTGSPTSKTGTFFVIFFTVGTDFLNYQQKISSDASYGMFQTKLTTFIVEKCQQILMRIREALLHTDYRGSCRKNLWTRPQCTYLHNVYSWDKLFGLCGSKRVVWITSNVMLPRQFQLKVNTHVHLEREKLVHFLPFYPRKITLAFNFQSHAKKTVFFFRASKTLITSLLVNTMDQNSRGGKKKFTMREAAFSK